MMFPFEVMCPRGQKGLENHALRPKDGCSPGRRQAKNGENRCWAEGSSVNRNLELIAELR